MKNTQMQIKEQQFPSSHFAKNETLMTIGNGYLGMRSSFEENYTGQTRGHFIAGVYNNAGKNEVSELANCADVLGMVILVDKQELNLFVGTVSKYERYLDMATGELVRTFTWQAPNGHSFDFEFRRFASFDNLHLVASLVRVRSHQQSSLQVKTGIDGRQTNSGVQHFFELDKRILNEHYMYARFETSESLVETSYMSVLSGKFDYSSFHSNRRRLFIDAKTEMNTNEWVSFEKINLIYTSQDEACRDEQAICQELQTLKTQGYEVLAAQNSQRWQQFWDAQQVQIESSHTFDQLALNFALYHLQIMTPKHDTRLSIAAKGLSGEGYKGHVFWDTEIFMLPYFLYTQPEIAKQLLTYRALHIPQAQQKAQRNGYEGTLFPWESAYSGQEETPEWAAINIRTGKRQKIASALAEHHIVADISFAVCQYYQASDDDEFMRGKGMELLIENARFWMSRATRTANDVYSICDVIGPDEYTEHVDNNAYTNYLVRYTLSQLQVYITQFARTDLSALAEQINEFLAHLYIPVANEQGILPQDDSFLSKPTIDLAKYKKDAGKQTILLDYSRTEVNEMQILKQADTIMLLYLLRDQFSPELIETNWHYYEQRTIHDSSLSKAIYAIVALFFDNQAIAYEFFERASEIDLGDDMYSSDEGIHAASLGALWSVVTFGFGGIYIARDQLHIEPRIPKQWTGLRFPFVWKKSKLWFTYTEDEVRIENESALPVTIYYEGVEKHVTKQIIMKRSR